MTHNNGFHIPAFSATRGTMQGVLVSTTLLNVVVDNVIRTWLNMKVEDHRVDHDRSGETVRRRFGVLYANDGMVGSQDPD